MPIKAPYSLRTLRAVAGLCAALVCLLCTAGSARAQISPGPLARAHSGLSGPAHCADCHEIARGSRQLRCLHCHVEIQKSLSTAHGLHATSMGKSTDQQQCARCHSDHNGENFNMIRWEPSLEKFDHSKTGYSLEGKHAGLECKKCHTPEHIAPADRAGIQMKDLRKTYLGLSQACLSCHADAHHGQLNAECQRCHTVMDWKPATLFKHGNARYPLTGAHETVPCQKCHPTIADAKPYAKYRPLAFAACTDCHKDPHRGTFKATCESCHNTASWKKTKMGEPFDHSKTKFPLLGKHETVPCAKCHHAGDFKAPVAHALCGDCHKPDPHHGQFAQRPDKGECASCHTEKNWKPSTFGVAQHAKTNYPLEGKHVDAPCMKCHLPRGEATLFKITKTQCRDCHEDVHRNQFAGAPYNNRCEQCHTVEAFRPAKFTLAQHNKTRYPLTGGHAAVPCLECHKPPSPGAAAKYHFEDVSCTVCHKDPHRGQFADRMRAPRAGGGTLGCESCHTVESWQELSRFDHNTTRFALDGAHKKTPCEKCHFPAIGEKKATLNYRIAPRECSGCHEDIHAGQFAKFGKAPACTTCHTTAKWKPSTFDHEKGTTFSLKGAHATTPCADCHKTIRAVGGKQVLFYKPTPRECKDCHGPA